jgi:RNA polymerase sigma-70 factor (ECF subfamily)
MSRFRNPGWSNPLPVGSGAMPQAQPVILSNLFTTRIIASQVIKCNATPVHQDESDENLMTLYSEGNYHAFEVLYHRHKGPVFRFFRRQLNQAKAEELSQDVWSNLIHSRNSYKAESKFTTYLYTIARHRLIDHIRRQTIRMATLIDSDSQNQEHASGDCANSDNNLPHAPLSDNPEQQVMAMNEKSRLLECIKQLPLEQREAFLLKEESGLSLETIGDITGTNRESIKSRLRYALKKLKQCMGDML